MELFKCSIVGSPKPKNSPHYPEFTIFKHQNTLQMSENNDLVWLLTRYCCRNRSKLKDFNGTNKEASAYDGVEDIPDVELSNECTKLQVVPVWAAYNSAIASTITESRLAVDQAYALPLINAPAHKWPTLVTSLMQLHELQKFSQRN